MPTLIVLLLLVGKCLAMRFPAQSTQFSPQELQHVIELSECGPDPLNSVEHESSIEPDTIVSDPDKTTEPLLNLSCRTENQAIWHVALGDGLTLNKHRDRVSAGEQGQQRQIDRETITSDSGIKWPSCFKSIQENRKRTHSSESYLKFNKM
ncbi:hypothetical protein PGTUg99_033359 [Puccinia graminis f. sp. tritici]|uniref:Uncharacterized protein n=1 Tax=Puccinia graminis f. sp. tritici TaxID=56615 RepID=A0A5B0RR31_PUCGR|nr:hypothetical protein PGTUg99_033359 [Puccinia graminis f. sp. tritici]